MFKEYPKKENLKIIVLPELTENIGATSCISSENYNEIMKEY